MKKDQKILRLFLRLFLRTQRDFVEFIVTLVVPELLYWGLEEKTCPARKEWMEKENRFMFFYFCSLSSEFFQEKLIFAFQINLSSEFKSPSDRSHFKKMTQTHLTDWLTINNSDSNKAAMITKI